MMSRFFQCINFPLNSLVDRWSRVHCPKCVAVHEWGSKLKLAQILYYSFLTKRFIETGLPLDCFGWMEYFSLYFFVGVVVAVPLSAAMPGLGPCNDGV